MSQVTSEHQRVPYRQDEQGKDKYSVSLRPTVAGFSVFATGRNELRPFDGSNDEMKENWPN